MGEICDQYDKLLTCCLSCPVIYTVLYVNHKPVRPILDSRKLYTRYYFLVQEVLNVYLEVLQGPLKATLLRNNKCGTLM